MELALQLARRRKGLTHPNPTVGCVVVREGEIVGLGYHERAGLPHAEIVALDQAGEKAKGSTVYLTLEPCVHFGKTPPCTDALVRFEVRRVVVATLDPNPLVSGKGIGRLKREGIEVEIGLCEEEAKELNEDFFTYIVHKRPYVTLKLAQTVDGRVATVSGDSKWITSLKSRKFAHRLRSEASAILVGINTVLKDDPLLTIRHFPFERQPMRIVVDPELDIPLHSKVITDRSAETLVVFSKRDLHKERDLRDRGAHLLYMERISLRDLLRELANRGIVHLLVEGGAYTITQFLREGVWDRIVVFQAPKLIGEGLGIGDLGVKNMDQALGLKLRREIKLGEERVFEYVKS